MWQAHQAEAHYREAVSGAHVHRSAQQLLSSQGSHCIMRQQPGFDKPHTKHAAVCVNSHPDKLSGRLSTSALLKLQGLRAETAVNQSQVLLEI